MLAGCGGGNANSSAESNNTGNDRVVIYTAAEDERIAYIQQELDKKFPDTEIVIQSLGTGQLLSKLQAEGVNTDCDIFYDLEVVNAEIILNENPDLFVDLSDYDFSVYDSSVTGYTDRHHKYARFGWAEAHIPAGRESSWSYPDRLAGGRERNILPRRPRYGPVGRCASRFPETPCQILPGFPRRRHGPPRIYTRR